MHYKSQSDSLEPVENGGSLSIIATALTETGSKWMK
jgi:transcription termination factor Rho